MKINKNSFELNEIAKVELDSTDNEGLINIPKNIKVSADIENYFGKILINALSVNYEKADFELTKSGVEKNITLLDLKLLDRHIFKSLSDKSGIGYSPYTYFLDYDLTAFEKGRRLSDLDWAMFSSLYIYSCHVLPSSVKVELSLAKHLRISEENFKRFMKKIPTNIFRKSGHIDARGGDISLEAENLIKQYLGESSSEFENNPYMKFYSDSDLA